MKPFSLLTRSRFSRNFGVAVFGQFVSVFAQFGPVPVLISHWGLERFGRWLIAASIQAFLTVVENGIGVGYQRRVIHQGVVPPGEVSKLVAQGILAHLAAAITGSLLALVAFGAFHFFGDQDPDSQITHVLFLGFGLNSLANIALGGPLLILRSQGKFATATFVSHLTRCVEILMVCLLVFLQGNELLVIGGMVLLKLALVLAGFVYAGAEGYTPSKLRALAAGFEWHGVREGMGTMLQPAYLAISLQGTLQTVGALLGNAAAGVFGLYRSLARIPLQATIPTLAPSMIEFADAHRSGDWKRLRAMFIKTNLLTIATTLLGGCVVYWFSGDILRILGKKMVVIDGTLLIWLLAASALSAQSLCIGQLLIGTGRFFLLGFAGVVLAVVLLIGCRFLGAHASLHSIALAYVAFELVLLIVGIGLCRFHEKRDR